MITPFFSLEEADSRSSPDAGADAGLHALEMSDLLHCDACKTGF